MAREMRWRGWHKESKSMYVLVQVTMQPDEGSIQHVICIAAPDSLYLGLLDEYMEYTNAKDRNGREIYEGDIVKAVRKGKPDYIFRVKWDSDFCGFVLPDSYDPGIVWGLGQDNIILEVIGNEYQNPELMPDEE